MLSVGRCNWAPLSRSGSRRGQTSKWWRGSSIDQSGLCMGRRTQWPLQRCQWRLRNGSLTRMLVPTSCTNCLMVWPHGQAGCLSCQGHFPGCHMPRALSSAVTQSLATQPSVDPLHEGESEGRGVYFELAWSLTAFLDGHPGAPCGHCSRDSLRGKGCTCSLQCQDLLQCSRWLHCSLMSSRAPHRRRQ